MSLVIAWSGWRCLPYPARYGQVLIAQTARGALQPSRSRLRGKYCAVADDAFPSAPSPTSNRHIRIIYPVSRPAMPRSIIPHHHGPHSKAPPAFYSGPRTLSCGNPANTPTASSNIRLRYSSLTHPLYHASFSGEPTVPIKKGGSFPYAPAPFFCFWIPLPVIIFECASALRLFFHRC